MFKNGELKFPPLTLTTPSPSPSSTTCTVAVNLFATESRGPLMSCWEERSPLLPDTEMSARDLLNLREALDVVSLSLRSIPLTPFKPCAKDMKSPQLKMLLAVATFSSPPLVVKISCPRNTLKP